MPPRRAASLCRAVALLAWTLCVVGPSTAAPSAPPPPDNSACGASYHANATRQLRLAPKAGFGVIFVAQHGDPERARYFIDHAIRSANSYRDTSIQLPRALITGASALPLPGARPRGT